VRRYLLAHWRGELPIRRSFWFNGVRLSASYAPPSASCASRKPRPARSTAIVSSRSWVGLTALLIVATLPDVALVLRAAAR
jgi:hypothetical protein